ncbi:MAG TPA: hypothetical protein VK211_15905, partial [Kamptonema sp.]|nr:hypothetical protein [Kamptonema sp.]
MQSLNFADIQPFVDNPEQLANQPISYQISVANYLLTPRNLLEVLVNSSNSQVAEAARLHVNWGGEIVENWEEVADAVLRNAQLEQNDRLAVELLKFAPVPDYFLSEWVPANPLLEGLRNPYLPTRFRIKILERLAREPSLEPRLQMAELADTPLAILEQLAGDLELPIRRAVQYNPNCPTELILRVESQHNAAQDWNTDPQQLAILAESSWSWVRLAVAQNPYAPPEVLVKLAGDTYEKIQLAVARNPASPEGAIAMLANHPENSVRDAVAKHPKLREQFLLDLLNSQDSSFDQVINRNPYLPPSVLERLAQEPKYYNYLIQHPTTSGNILAEIRDRVNDLKRAEIARHPQVLASTLEQLAQDSNSRVRLAVALNSKTPEQLRSQLLEQLAADSRGSIRAGVAGDRQTPIYLLEQIGREELSRSQPDHLVYAALLININTPTALQVQLIEKLTPEQIENSFYDWELRLALGLNPNFPETKRTIYFARSAGSDGNQVAEHPDTPTYILAQLAALGDWRINERLAKNPNTPAHILRKLALDSRESVRINLAENCVTPADVLIQLASPHGEKTINNASNVRDRALKNPNLPPLERYRLSIAQAEAEEIAKANQ